MASRQSRARQDQAGAAVRDRDRDARTDARPLAGRDGRLLRRVQVVAGVAVARAGRCAGGLAQAREAERHSPGEPSCVPGPVLPDRPFTSKRSNRGATPAGTRARTRTPSAVSSRSISPARSCSSDRLPPSR